MTPHLNRLDETVQMRGQNCLNATVQMRGHNISFYAELTKIISNYHQMLLLSRALKIFALLQHEH